VTCCDCGTLQFGSWGGVQLPPSSQQTLKTVIASSFRTKLHGVGYQDKSKFPIIKFHIGGLILYYILRIKEQETRLTLHVNDDELFQLRLSSDMNHNKLFLTVSPPV
jgi:hypothetical protein